MMITMLYNLAAAEHIEIYPLCMRKREAFSMMDPDGTCYIAIDPTKITSWADEKTKLAHELGHCITGAFYNPYAICDIRQRHENKADKWAIKKLIPEDELRKAINDGYTTTADLADYFGVNESLIRKAYSWYTFGNLCECG